MSARRRVAQSSTQVSAKSGVFWDVGSHLGDEAPYLTVVESVRCLECGFVYAKPAGGGTVRENPGCPDCGYVGWLSTGLVEDLTREWSPSHSDADHLPHRPS
jgi:hypothetical protein